jgi:hypothetical protein
MERYRAFHTRFRQAFDELMSLPDTERQERVRRALAKSDASRAERSRPMPREEMRKRWRALRDDPDMILLAGAGGYSNFWATIDARDSAQAIEKGLLADYTGSHPLFVNDSHNATGIASETLLGVFFPEVVARRRPIDGSETLVSIDKARSLIGFEPEYSISKHFESM